MRDYLQGILDAYAVFGMPASELTYDYKLFELEKSEKVEELLLKSGFTFSHAEIIEESYFKEKVRGWLFSGSFGRMNFDPRRKEAEFNTFFDAFILLAKPDSFNRCILVQNGFIGAMYDFFLIEGKERNYILYFISSD
ncbi:hypothetical protein [uncultured Chryseobacterium sp.]|uniref:hypothetical protein n=1 Tax=uncultured Chryseobacterium sp. TaxID=259322 RepID=UPI0025DD7A8E|nr:hypothetical protein [uncultured Chryseobacterium sp.]